MPNFPIVDSHVHLWDPNYFRLPWLDGAPAINTLHGLKEYAAHTAGPNIDIEAMVYLEVDIAPHYALMEPVWVAARAQEDPRIKAIVATAPVEFGEQTRAYLEALVKTTPLVKGIRRLVQGEADDHFQTQPRFIRGAQMLADYGLSFDICIKHWQLPATIELVKQCPNVSFILDHIGKPNIASGELEPWRANIFKLAELPNVICKVSGMANEAAEKWTLEDLRPYFETVYEAFGEDRVAFGGDWPVCTLATTYSQWVKTMETLTAPLSESAQRKLWNENAKRFYRI